MFKFNESFNSTCSACPNWTASSSCANVNNAAMTLFMAAFSFIIRLVEVVLVLIMHVLSVEVITNNLINRQAENCYC